MMRAVLIAVVLAGLSGLSATAMASDRVSVIISAEFGDYYPVHDRYYYGGRYYGRDRYYYSDRGYYRGYRYGYPRYYGRGHYYGKPRYYYRDGRRYYPHRFDHRYRGHRNYRENWGPGGKYYSDRRY